MLLLALMPIAAMAEPHKLDMQALEKLTMDYSPLIKQAMANRDAARARQIESQGAYLPQLSAEANVRNTHIDRGSSGNPQSEDQQSQEAGLYLSQTLFDYSSWSNIKSTATQVLAYDEQVRNVHNIVLSEVRQAYFAARIAEKLLEVAQEMEKDTLAFRERMRIMLESGLVPQLDLARAEYDLAEATRNVISAQSDMRKAYARLALAVGMDEIYYMRLKGEVQARGEIFSYDEEKLVQMALKFHPEVKRLDYMAQAAQYAIDESMGGHLPVLTFQGNLGRSGDYSFDNDVHSYGIYMSLPLFQGFRVQGAVMQYQALYRVAQQALIQARLDARRNMHVAYQNLQETLAKVKVSQTQVVSAEENWRLVESRYQEGMATPLELSEARTNRFQALALLASDEITVLSSLAVLDEAAGGALFPFEYQRRQTGYDH